MPTKSNPEVCVWCLGRASSRDHIVPESIGGTLDYAVPACGMCQSILSKIEHTLARKSDLALLAVATEKLPRHPKRPESGVLQAKCLTTKNPLGGYTETMQRAGGEIRSLSHLEVKVAPGEPIQGRVRGQSFEESEELIEAVRSVVLNQPGPDGMLFEFLVSQEIPAEIAADPDFWPRVVLRPDRRLMLRARNPQEAANVAVALRHIMMEWQPRDPKNWVGVTIEKSVPHSVILDFKPQEVRRVVAKIAYGMVRFFGGTLAPEEDKKIREYILSGTTDQPEPVEEGLRPENVTTDGLTYHWILLSDQDNPNTITVALYGLTFLITFATMSGLSATPTVILCRFDGLEMRVADPLESATVLAGHRQVAAAPSLGA